MAKTTVASEFFTNGVKNGTPNASNKIVVKFNSSIITANMENVNNPLYILKVVYEPMLEISSKFYIATKGAFKLQVDSGKKLNVSKEQSTELYRRLEVVNSAFVDFSSQKAIFELQEQGSGYRLNDFLVYYKALINALFDFNTLYAELYVDNMFTYKDYSSVNVDLNDTFDQEAARTYYYYEQLILGQIAFDYYVDNYTFTADPKKIGNISSWLDSCTQLNELLDNFEESKVGGSSNNVFGDITFGITAANLPQVRAALIDFQRTRRSFEIDTKMFADALDGFDYKEYFSQSEAGKVYYLENATDLEKAYHNFAQTYLSNQLTTQIGWLDRMLEIF